MQNHPDQGSTFRILFPANQGAVEPVLTTPLSAPLIHSGTALLIDDEEIIREVVGQILHEIGFDVLAARNGAEGVAVFRTHQEQVKFIVLDSKMPVMDGEEAYQQIRHWDQAVPIIFSSGYSEAKLRCPTTDTHLSYLQKPYHLEAFIAKIDEVVAARGLG